jgi:hypothetical protein
VTTSWRAEHSVAKNLLLVAVKGRTVQQGGLFRHRLGRALRRICKSSAAAGAWKT